MLSKYCNNNNSPVVGETIAIIPPPQLFIHIYNRIVAIKNKDGSIFQLRKPNPLAKEQIWNNLILHNCEWKGEVVSDAEKALPVIEIPKEAESIVMEDPLFDDGIHTEATLDKKSASDQVLKNIIRIHCLPATITIEEDKLYEEIKRIVTYGDKFAFEAVITNVSDMMIIFWTNKLLTRESIIFPSTYIKGNIQFGDYRWWKVDSIEEKNGGYLITSIISEIQPDFS